MANYKELLTSTTSTEDIIDSFEERDEAGHLKYSRLLLDLLGYYGSASLKITLIVKRCPYICESNGNQMTFTDIKNYMASSSGFFHMDVPLFKELNAFIHDYNDYYIEYVGKEIVKPVEYVFENRYTFLARGMCDKYKRKYGECREYELYGVIIRPSRRQYKKDLSE